MDASHEVANEHASIANALLREFEFIAIITGLDFISDHLKIEEEYENANMNRSCGICRR